MFRCAILALAVASAAPAADTVPVEGSSVRFPKTITVPANGKTVTLKVTGTALRTRAIFSVYAVGSYLEESVAAKNADELLKADAVKVMYIVMERNVSGKDFLETVKTAVLKGRPANAFAAEFAKLGETLSDKTAAKGDHVSLAFVPGTGLRVQIVGKADVTLKNDDFAKAVWEIYLGANPLTAEMKASLVSILGK